MSYDNPRIKLNMSGFDILKVMSEGNPGAISVLAMIVEKAPEIDPDDIFSYLGAIMQLDSLDIYGARIWMLFKDVCGQNINHTLGLLRAVQLGIIKERKLNLAIDGKKTMNICIILGRVKQRLPNFVMEKAA